MQSNKIKVIVTAFLISFAALIIVNCGNSRSAPSGSNNNVAAVVENSNSKKPVFIQAEDLLKEYRENPVAADRKYKDKLLAVTGKTTGHFGTEDKILWIGINSSGFSDTSPSDPNEIECGNGDLIKSIEGDIEVEQEITLVGINQGVQPGIKDETIKNILLNNCRIEDKTVSPK